HQEMEELISDALLDDPEVRTIPNIASVDWAIRKSKSLERWKELRPDLIQYMLKAENTVQTLCSYCRNKKAVLRCQDCLPKQYYCEDCDLSFHAVFVLHNRDSMVDGFFMPIPPTTNGYWPASVSYETIYSMDLFSMFEDMKVIAPAMSLQAFTRTLERRTSHFGRVGKICDSTFQRSYLEWNYCRFEIDQLCHVQHFKCPACMPNMLAVSVDGNRKHYRFKKG
ncbi:hypothetical protein AMEX_G16890, partial [Astyanax mexicanus]